MAAERAGAPLLAVAGVYRLAQALVAGWKLDQAERAASSDALGLAGRLHDGNPEVASLYGALNLVRAIVASRRGNAVIAWQAIAEAETAAQLLGVERNDFDTEFGPTIVALHAVAVAVELGEAGEAIRRAHTVQAEGLSRERQARFARLYEICFGVTGARLRRSCRPSPRRWELAENDVSLPASNHNRRFSTG
jgi:hypothetical protein